LPQLNDALAKLAYGNKQYDRAAAAAERVLAGNPASADTLLLLGETRAAQGRHGEAVTLFQRAIDARTASGAKADESWYRRAIAIAHQGKQPTLELARKWVAAHPSPASWRDAISIYRNQVRPDNELLFDTLRLARAVGAMNSGDDASMYAFYAIESWAGADAKSVLDDAVSRGVFNRADPKNKELFAAAQTAKGQDRAWLTASAKEVAAAPTGRNALKVGDGFYGVGDYTRAVELYRLALSKGSVDANSVKLRIGAALARSGDKAAATAALKEVGGPQAELAKFWLLHLSTSA
jgi:tetratricopeptide (TPR) repeat protein